ncbi:hypothetical protein ACFLW4_03835 [Chloroflexota bacterium]
MEKSTITTVDVGTTKTGTALAELKLRVAEHIIAQNDCYRPDEVRSILDETKVGAWRKPALLKKLQMVFSFSMD